jgi:urease accessory protein
MDALQKRMLLLQVNDALFPIGGYSHSYGLETYIQKGIVRDESSAAEYIGKRMALYLAYADLLAIRLCHEAAAAGDIAELEGLADLTEACQVPMETRQAARKLGSRFVKTVEALGLRYEGGAFGMLAERRGSGLTHACAYGAFCASAGIGLDCALEHYLYAQVSAMVTACVKSVPLSQTSGQRILSQALEASAGALERTLAAGKGMLYASAPGFDLRCIQHESLYSRIYMS